MVMFNMVKYIMDNKKSENNLIQFVVKDTVYNQEALVILTPPSHGGIAYGFDRLLAILLGESSIREVIAFPKTGDGRDLMMDAPSEITKKQLDELHIGVKKIEKVNS